MMKGGKFRVRGSRWERVVLVLALALALPMELAV
jgi:hypothetical protein